MTPTLPSGRPSYWRWLEERPEGVYAKLTNLKAERVATLAKNLGSYAEVRIVYPELDYDQVRACQAWAADRDGTAKQGEVATRE